MHSTARARAVTAARSLALSHLAKSAHVGLRSSNAPTQRELFNLFTSRSTLTSTTISSSRLQVRPNSSSTNAKASSPSTSTSTPVSASKPTTETPPSTSDISRVVPPLPSQSGSELGSASNQTSASSAYLAHVAEQKAQAARIAKEERDSQPLMKRIWKKVKEEAAHYWHGSKLLGKEVRISARLLRRLMMGYGLTRRERRQLKRTTADLLRLIPFVPFIIIPAGELLLPLAIKIFPNMLPSTFESKFAVEEKRRGLIKVRLEMAKFLQETVREGGIQPTDKVQTSDEFKEFFRKVRSTGESPSDEDIISVAKLFDDDLTLDNLTRPQLVSMCRYMQINAFGTDNYLRYQIRAKLNRIKQDDIVINAEGVDSLSHQELVSACNSRGIQTLNLGDEQLKEEVKQWINLHLHEKISGTLLVLSKAFNYVARVPGNQGDDQSQLKSLELTLSSLPDTLLNEAELNVSKEQATNKQRLEVLQQQEELIEDEAEQEESEAKARKEEKERKQREKKRLQKEEEEARALLPRNEMKRDEDLDPRMTNEQLYELGEALSILSAKSSVLKEREELAQLIKEVSEVDVKLDEGSKPDAEKLSETTKTVASEMKSSESQDAAAASASSSSEKEQEQEQEQEKEREREKTNPSPAASSSSRSLAKRVKSMLEKIDLQLEEYDKDVGSRMHIIEASPSGKISVDDLEQALRLIKHKPEEEILEKIVDKLDIDNDGLVPLSDVLELAQQESSLGVLRDDNVIDIKAEGKELKQTNQEKSSLLKKQQSTREKSQDESQASSTSTTTSTTTTGAGAGAGSTEEAINSIDGKEAEKGEEKKKEEKLRKEDIVE